MTVEEKFRYIAEHNGLEKALDKMAEECAEYAAARIKYNLGEGKGEYLEELADVIITRAEVQMLMPEDMKDQISKEINRKLDRQIERIRKEVSIRKHMDDGWILVDVRQPEVGESVLVSFLKDGFQTVIAHISERGRWIMLQGAHGYNDITDDVIAWRPLPEPYKPEKEDTQGKRFLV